MSFITSLRRVGPHLLIAKFMLLLVSWASVSSVNWSPYLLEGTPLFGWDSLHYLEILTLGYPQPESKSFIIAFLPLYPLLSWPLTQWLSEPLALILISNITSFLGYVLFHVWCSKLVGERTAFWATMIAISYPPAFFSSCAYTEGPFVLVTAAVLLLLRNRSWWLAAFIAGLGSALRPQGILLSGLVLMTHLMDGLKLDWRMRIRHGVVTCALGALSISGLGLYQIYLFDRYDDPSVYFDSHKHWSGADLGEGWTSASERTSPARTVIESVGDSNNQPSSVSEPHPLWRKVTSAGAWSKFIALSLVIASIMGIAQRGPVPKLGLLYCVGLALLGYLPDDGARHIAISRYMVPALPCFLYVAHYAERFHWVPQTLVGASFAMQMLFMWAFSLGSWRWFVG